MDADFSQAWKSLNGMAAGFMARLPYLIVAIIVFLLFLLLAKGSAHLIHNFARKRRKHRNLGYVLGRLTQGTLVLLGLLVALVIAIPTFKPGQLVQVLGLSTVAIGFAFRDVLQNFLAGVIILLTEPFRIGDQIRINEFQGVVEDIYTRATAIRTFDRRKVVIPNSDFFTKSVAVATAYQSRRIEHVIGIGYGDTIDSAKRVILGALARIENVLKDPKPDVKVSDLAASTVNLTVRWWIAPTAQPEEIDSRDEVLTAIKNELTAHGIDLPFTTQTILFHDQTDENDGNRARQREGWPAGMDAVPASRTIAGAIRSATAEMPHSGQNGLHAQAVPTPRREGESD